MPKFPTDIVSTPKLGTVGHFNLLGWDGRGSAPYLFPERGTP